MAKVRKDGVKAQQEAARAAGEEFFDAGRPCKNGHNSLRRTNCRTCLECERAKYEKNKDRILAQQVEYRRNNADKLRAYHREWADNNRDKTRAYTAKWQSANQDKIAAYKAATRTEMREYQAAYYAENRDRVLARQSAYAKANPAKARLGTRAYRARKRGAEGSHTSEDVERIFRDQKCKCAMCRVSLKGKTYHVDHIQALANGGTNWPSNLQILCPSCNTSKSDKCPIEFARQKGMLL